MIIKKKKLHCAQLFFFLTNKLNQSRTTVRYHQAKRILFRNREIVFLILSFPNFRHRFNTISNFMNFSLFRYVKLCSHQNDYGQLKQNGTNVSYGQSVIHIYVFDGVGKYEIQSFFFQLRYFITVAVYNNIIRKSKKLCFTYNRMYETVPMSFICIEQTNCAKIQCGFRSDPIGFNREIGEDVCDLLYI